MSSTTKDRIHEIVRSPEVERWRAIGRDLDRRAFGSSGETARAQRLGAQYARSRAIAIIFDGLGMHE